MRSPFRFAGIIIVIFAACGLARAEEIAPAGSGVSIDKMIVDNGPAHTVKYFVRGGSPRLEALVRRVEWAENELSVIDQLQLLKLDTVVNERRVAAFRTTQLTNPFNPPGLIPFPIGPGHGGDGESPLQRALAGQLACEATPQAALQLIGFLEQMQTQLDAELKALPPVEQKVIQGPIDALRPRLAALPRVDAPPPPAQPAVPGLALATQPQGATAAPVAAPQVRLPAPAVAQQPPMPPDQVAIQQRVRQNQEVLRQQVMRMEQQFGLRLPVNLMALQQ
jgi:hypothetical protein